MRSYETILPRAEAVNNVYDMTIMVSVSDNLGAMINATATVTVSPPVSLLNQ